jgi:phosphatidylglycerophosphatase A
MQFSTPPAGLTHYHPATFLATWGWSGLLPLAPGTWGSLFTLPIAWILATHWEPSVLFLAALIVFITGLWASTVYLRHSTVKDPGTIVIDEAAGQFLVLAIVPLDFWWYLAGLVLFRIADILKPWPASWADQNLAGALGVMTDDIFAAGYAVILLYGAKILIGG